MKKTFAHISVALESEIGVPSLLTLAEAHEENWEASTTAPQTYETTIELQKAGIDQRWIAGREYRTEAGTFSVFAAGTRIETEKIPPGEVDHVEYLRLRGPLASAIEQALEVSPDRPLILPGAPAELAITLSEATKIVFQRPPHWPWRFIAAASELTRALISARRKTPLPSDHLVDRVRSLVEEAPHHPWSVKELAVRLQVRREVLWALFKEQTGQSPGDWVRQHRIRVAREMLKRGLSVRQTAERLGYSSRQQFARSYGTVTGQAPSVRAPVPH
jgi:AraC-like DNA-binding protein